MNTFQTRTNKAKFILGTIAKSDAICDRKHGWMQGQGKCVRTQQHPMISLRAKRSIAVGAVGAGVTLAFLGIAADRKYGVSDKLTRDLLSKSYLALSSDSFSQIMDDFKKSDVPQKIKSAVINLSGATKVFTAKQLLLKRGAELVSVDKDNNISTWKTPNGFTSIFSINDKIVTFNSIESGGFGGKFPIYGMAFQVNESYDKKEHSREESAAIIGAAKKMFSSQLDLLPENVVLKCKAYSDDGAGDKRSSIYRRMGFRHLDVRGGELWATKNLGKFQKIPDSNVDYFSKVLSGRTDADIRPDSISGMKDLKR